MAVPHHRAQHQRCPIARPPANELHVAGSINANTRLLIGSNSNFLTSQLKVGDGTNSWQNLDYIVYEKAFSVLAMQPKPF